MKREMILMVLVFASFHLVSGQAAVRKPSVEIFVNGKMYQNGDEITVQKGQVLELKALQKGGRRDFVSYPDSYLKITPDMQVHSRGSNRLVYSEKGISSEWKLLSENATFSSDNQITFKKNPSSGNEASARIGVSDFSRTYLKINLSTIWQLTSGEEQKTEKNESEAFIYFNIAGATDTWYVSKNIHSLGTKTDGVAAILNNIQNNFDTIEYHLTHLKYNEVQKDIRDLQVSVNSLNNNMQQERAKNPAFNTEIHFVGLPSDRSIADLDVFETLQMEWSRLNTFIHQQTSMINSASVNTVRLKTSIQKYLDWQYSLPDNWMVVMGLYIPQLNTDNVIVPATLQSILDENIAADSKSVDQMKAFLNSRIENIELEIQQITQIKSRLQAVKLFDGMLRSYFSSINWIEWENSREVGFALAK